MAGVGNIVDLLLFYTSERILFNRMIGKPIGKRPQLVKMALAFWLLLEEIGYHDVTRKIHSFDDSTIEAIFNETLACLDCIQSNAIEPIGKDDALVFSDILDDPISLRFCYYNSDFMFGRFTHIMDTVCNKIFGKNGAIEVDLNINSTKPLIRTFGEGGSSQGVATDAARAMVSDQNQWQYSTLDPNASEFLPRRSNEDDRTMFLTFSKGYPLTREEIIDFFTSNWGYVVEDVVVEAAAGGDAPLYGRAIFTRHSIIATILNGQAKAKFLVGRKHLWARVYVPKRR